MIHAFMTKKISMTSVLAVLYISACWVTEGIQAQKMNALEKKILRSFCGKIRKTRKDEELVH